MPELDAIESIDWGAYAHFRYQAGQFPSIMPFMQLAYYLGSYVSIGLLFSLAALVFFLRGKYRSTQVTALSLAASVALIHGMHYLFPRKRPSDAQLWLCTQEIRDSYPSKGVFLFMLAMIFLGFALWTPLRSALARTVYCLATAGLTVWVCFGQFFLGTHFMTDIVGGLVGALAVCLIANPFLEGETDAPGRTTGPS